MKEPTTPEEVLAMHQILRSDPNHYLQITNDWISQDPNNSHAYFDRHFAWLKLDKPQRAIEDLDKVIELNPDQAAFLARGEVYRQIGEYQKAIEDFDRGEAINSTEWRGHVLGLLYQADCHARLGDEESALAYCARLPDNFWTPGLDGATAGNKTEVATELRRIAAEARRTKI